MSETVIQKNRKPESIWYLCDAVMVWGSAEVVTQKKKREKSNLLITTCYFLQTNAVGYLITHRRK